MHLLYNNSTGEIIGHFQCSPSVLDKNLFNLPGWQGAVEYFGEPVSGATHYHDLINTVRPRPIIEAEPDNPEMFANGLDSITISGLPIPCTVKVDNIEYLVDDGVFEFTTDVEGTYTIVAEQFPYITKSWEILAV